MNNELTQAVCQSVTSDTVVKFLNQEDFTDNISNMISDGQIWGVYYDEDGDIVAQDIWGEVHKNVLKINE